jgi:hypothetical protein
LHVQQSAIEADAPMRPARNELQKDQQKMKNQYFGDKNQCFIFECTGFQCGLQRRNLLLGAFNALFARLFSIKNLARKTDRHESKISNKTFSRSRLSVALLSSLARCISVIVDSSARVNCNSSVKRPMAVRSFCAASVA